GEERRRGEERGGEGGSGRRGDPSFRIAPSPNRAFAHSRFPSFAPSPPLSFPPHPVSPPPLSPSPPPPHPPPPPPLSPSRSPASPLPPSLLPASLLPASPLRPLSPPRVRAVW